ncbi:MAG: cell division ATP-binding protein FtsE [Burkholderiales bacterium]|nr:cell division ATP-binding protein FtsE [Burkholderiales bacterium]
MIRFEHVDKRYPGGIIALQDVSLRIERGELVVIAGASGAGKSTMLKLIAAVEQPSAGRVSVNDEDLRGLRARALPYLRRQLGLVFQDHKLLFDRSVFDNVALPLAIAGLGRKETSRRVDAALDKVGLLGRSHASPIALSGGEQQRLCIARAIVHRPAILLADEPTGNLDPDHAGAIATLFESFNRAGVTVVIATHDRVVIERLRPRRLDLQAGRLLEAAP